MGSIVGGAYAAGHTPEDMEALLNGADWDTIFSDRPPRKDLSFRRKEDDLRLIGKSELGIKRDGLVLPRGAFGSQNLEEFLRLISRPASDARHLDALPIPLRAVATDLETGELVVLHDVPLPIAMRASMSVPGVFAPTQVDGRLLGDGGLVRNLPVEVAREHGRGRDHRGERGHAAAAARGAGFGPRHGAADDQHPHRAERRASRSRRCVPRTS